jgi:RNA polymerase primary sigma factor
VGQSLSVTRERIRQIEAKALKKLKTPAVKEMFAAIQ